MTALTNLLGAAETDQIIRCTTDRLAPDYQIGDHLVIRPQKAAEAGDVVVSSTEDGWTLGYWPGIGGDVTGRVIGLFRSVA
jgi:SOS-response transcriptional repressor LexA